MVPVTTRVFVGSRSTEFTFKKYETKIQNEIKRRELRWNRGNDSHTSKNIGQTYLSVMFELSLERKWKTNK